MSKLLKLQKLKKGVMAMGICWMYLSDVPIDEEKKNRPQTVHIGTNYRQ